MAARDYLGKQWKRPNAVSAWVPSSGALGGAHAIIGEDVAFDRATPEQQGGPFPTHQMTARVFPVGSRWVADVERGHDYDEYGGSYGEGQLAVMENAVNNKLADYRTERRAKVAAEAMINRRNEGRNYRTGRGIIDRGPGAGGRPY